MAYLVIVVDVPNDNIQRLNDQCQYPTKTPESINGLIDILGSVTAGTKPASVQITVRDSDPSVTTSGTGSTQDTYNHL